MTHTQATKPGRPSQGWSFSADEIRQLFPLTPAGDDAAAALAPYAPSTHIYEEMTASALDELRAAIASADDDGEVFASADLVVAATVVRPLPAVSAAAHDEPTVRKVVVVRFR